LIDKVPYARIKATLIYYAFGLLALFVVNFLFFFVKGDCVSEIAWSWLTFCTF